MKNLIDKIEYDVLQDGDFLQVSMFILKERLGNVTFFKNNSGSIIFLSVREDKAPYFSIGKDYLRILASARLKILGYRFS